MECGVVVSASRTELIFGMSDMLSLTEARHVPASQTLASPKTYFPIAPKALLNSTLHTPLSTLILRKVVRA